MSADREAGVSAGYLASGTWPSEMIAYERIELHGGLSAPRRARTIARDVLGSLVDDRRRNDLLVLVTELVTNAVRHAGVGPVDTLIVHLAGAADVIRVEVCDRGPGFDPADHEPRPDGGFGLPLLRALSDRWGVSVDDETCVWFEMDRLTSGRPAPASGQPRL
jgi:anti-sigma regulatory factor (Ser/Thr protein kinase)